MRSHAWNVMNYTYIGQTEQYSNNKIKNHKYDEEGAETKEKTTMCSHYYMDDHRFVFINVKIFNKKQFRKKHLEMIHINLRNRLISEDF